MLERQIQNQVAKQRIKATKGSAGQFETDFLDDLKLPQNPASKIGSAQRLQARQKDSGSRHAYTYERGGPSAEVKPPKYSYGGVA